MSEQMIWKFSILCPLAAMLVCCASHSPSVKEGAIPQQRAEAACECVEFTSEPFEPDQVVATPNLAGSWSDQFGTRFEVTRIRNGVYCFRGAGEDQSRPFFPPEQTLFLVGDFQFLYAPRMDSNDCGSLALVRIEGPKVNIRYFDPTGLASELSDRPGDVRFTRQPGAKRGCAYVVSAPSRAVDDFLRSMALKIEEFGIDQEFQLVRTSPSNP
jgi:hypothetical protein